MVQYINHALVPYFTKQRQNLKSPNQRALAVCDMVAAHRTEAVRAMVEENAISVVFIPTGATGTLFTSNFVSNNLT